jgi:hypothetical protein
MSDIGKYLSMFFEWVLVPAVLIGVLGFGIDLAPNDKTLRSSTTAGKVAGFILFVLFVVSQKGHTSVPSLAMPAYDIESIPLVVSASTLFFLSWTLNRILGTRLAGVLALLLISSSLITIYAYIFMPNYRAITIFVALGGALGVLLEKLIFERDGTEDPIATDATSRAKERAAASHE